MLRIYCRFLFHLFRFSDFLLRLFPFRVRHELSDYFFVIIFVTVVIHIVLDFLGGNPVALLHPGAEIDEPAAIGTKRPVRVIAPRRFFAAIWALYCARHGILN
jgi:hypothetical protein